MKNEINNGEHIALFDGAELEHCTSMSDMEFERIAWDAINRRLNSANILVEHDIELIYDDGRREVYTANYNADADNWDVAKK